MELTQLYLDGYSTTELANLFGVHRTTIQRKIKNQGILLRKKTPTSKYNIHTFSNINVHTCYWAGFIAADGCIRSDRNTVSMHLGIKDLNHLEKFKSYINLSSNIEIFNNSCRICISGKWFVEDLQHNFNITPVKSLTYIPPTLPKKLERHFWRGYFDGDGSVTKTSVPSMSVLGTKNTCLMFNNYISTLGIKLKSKNTTSPIVPAGNAFQISYSGKNAYIILHDMYHNSDFYLDRKKEKFEELFKKYTSQQE